MTDNDPIGRDLDDLLGQPFTVIPGTVYAQIGWYAPETSTLYRLTDDLSPAERLKPIYLYCGNIDADETPYHDPPAGTEPCA